MTIVIDGDPSAASMLFLFLLIMPGIAAIGGVIAYCVYWLNNIECGIACRVFRKCDCAKKAHARRPETNKIER